MNKSPSQNRRLPKQRTRVNVWMLFSLLVLAALVVRVPTRAQVPELWQLALPMALVFLVLICWIVVGVLQRRYCLAILHVTEQLQRISKKQEVHARLEVGEFEEIGSLCEEINRLLSQGAERHDRFQERELNGQAIL